MSLSYGGSCRADIAQTIAPKLHAKKIEVAAIAALSLGHLFCGSADGEISSILLHFLMELSAEDMNSQFAKLICIALSCIFIGQKEASKTIIETILATIDHPLGKYAATLVEIFSYTGTGDVLQIQKLLHQCVRSSHSSKIKDSKSSSHVDEASYITAAVNGIALIALSEETGKEMALRLFGQMMHYGDPSIKKTVPLAMALLYASHPSPLIVDILGKYSHDHDKNVQVNSLLAMGLVGAGTNNAKLASMLRSSAGYHAKESDTTFAIKLSLVPKN